MRLSAFEDQVKSTRPIEDGKPLSIKALCERLQVSKHYLWRRWRLAPWERGRGRLQDGRFLRSLAETLKEPFDKLLWLAGYNPFVGKGLSARQLYLLYEVLAKLVNAVRSGCNDDETVGALSLAIAELTADHRGQARAAVRIGADIEAQLKRIKAQGEIN